MTRSDSDLQLHGLGATRSHRATLQGAAFVFAQTAPDTIILIGVQRALQTGVNHLAGAADRLSFLDLLVCGSRVSHRENSSGSLSRHAALARQSKALLMCITLLPSPIADDELSSHTLGNHETNVFSRGFRSQV